MAEVDTDGEVLQICQFCMCEDRSFSLIVSPCLCCHHVHKMCLENWLNYKKDKKCDDCSFEFEMSAKLKYTFTESIRIWLEHPLNRTSFYMQFTLLVFLYAIASFLIGITSQDIICVLREELNPISHAFGRLRSFPLAVLPSIFLFIRCNIIFIRSQIVPWYRWWHSRIYYELKTHEN